MLESCEYNPEQQRAKYEGEPCHNFARISLGYNGKWHLCRSCSKLPEFKKFKVRRELKNE